jgi:guanosine-3',5'-bis(diphosphate) 3'-pyrophosphohydrolase
VRAAHESQDSQRESWAPGGLSPLRIAPTSSIELTVIVACYASGMNENIQRARDFAIAAHGNQTYGSRPYAFHLDAVASILAPYGETAQIIGYLHDTIEDTSATQEQIEAIFGDFIAACVSILTDEPGPDRKSRKTLTYAKMAKVEGEYEFALVAKAADRLANIRACVADGNTSMLEKYRSEHEALRAAAFRPGSCDALWQEMDALFGAKAMG